MESVSMEIDNIPSISFTFIYFGLQTPNQTKTARNYFWKISG